MNFLIQCATALMSRYITLIHLVSVVLHLPQLILMEVKRCKMISITLTITTKIISSVIIVIREIKRVSKTVTIRIRMIMMIGVNDNHLQMLKLSRPQHRHLLHPHNMIMIIHELTHKPLVLYPRSRCHELLSLHYTHYTRKGGYLFI